MAILILEYFLKGLKGAPGTNGSPGLPGARVSI